MGGPRYTPDTMPDGELENELKREQIKELRFKRWLRGVLLAGSLGMVTAIGDDGFRHGFSEADAELAGAALVAATACATGSSSGSGKNKTEKDEEAGRNEK